MLALERIGRLGGCGFSAALLGLAVIGGAAGSFGGSWNDPRGCGG